MRRYFFEIVAFILILGGLGFFLECVSALARHDYVAGVIVAVVGMTVLRVGAELARFALAERD